MFKGIHGRVGTARETADMDRDDHGEVIVRV